MSAHFACLHLVWRRTKMTSLFYYSCCGISCWRRWWVFYGLLCVLYTSLSCPMLSTEGSCSYCQAQWILSFSFCVSVPLKRLSAHLSSTKATTCRNFGVWFCFQSTQAVSVPQFSVTISAHSMHHFQLDSWLQMKDDSCNSCCCWLSWTSAPLLLTLLLSFPPPITSSKWSFLLLLAAFMIFMFQCSQTWFALDV